MIVSSVREPRAISDRFCDHTVVTSADDEGADDDS
jgi:hypothetical protein